MGISGRDESQFSSIREVQTSITEYEKSEGTQSMLEYGSLEAGSALSLILNSS
jgi:hypothetical protein